MSRFTNSITAFRMTQPADTFIWPAIIFTRANAALGRLTVRRTIVFVGGDFRVLLRFNFTSPFFTTMVQDCQAFFCLLFRRHKNSSRRQPATRWRTHPILVTVTPSTTIVIASDCKSVQLRAERDGTKDGRVYMVTVAVSDSSGKVGRATYKVSVPVGKKPAVDSGVHYTVTGSCGP